MFSSSAATEVVADGTTPGGESYRARVTVVPDGQAYRLRWEVSGDGADPPRRFDGVGIALDGVLYAGRSLPRDDDGAEHPGVVRYDITAPGDLPARWYHPSLNGTVCHGRSTDGPATGITGRYTADYSSTSESFATLVKTIVRVGDHYELSWRLGEDEQFGGVAATTGDELYCAWASPPRPDLHALRYEPRDGLLVADWVDLAVPRGTGRETLHLDGGRP